MGSMLTRLDIPPAPWHQSPMQLSRRSFCGAISAGCAALSLNPRPVWAQSAKQVPEARPTPEQLAWHDLELGMFIHFDMQTFTRQEKPRTPADVNAFNPANLDTDQWVEVAKSMGAKYAVFVAKHCTGFLSWQSDAYPYGVRQTNWREGKGDIVRDFVNSCRRAGIRPGLYASVSSNAWWGVDNPGVIKWGDKKQADYNQACERMLTELWSNYGELTEIWFDGGVLPPEEGGPEVYAILKRCQPKAIVFQGPAPGGIRWIGNEDGVAPYPCWSTVKKLNDSGAGDPEGTIWNPGECDVPLPGHGWFIQGRGPTAAPSDEEQQKTLRRLMDMYDRSVGHNCNLILNSTPDITGLIPAGLTAHYSNFGKEIKRQFSEPIAEISGEGNSLELTLKQPGRIDRLMLMEDISQGERIRDYQVEGLVPGNAWKPLCEGISVGHKRIQRFSPVEVAKIRFQARRAVGTPKIRRLAVFST